MSNPQYWTPPDKKLPVLLFTRIRYDFGEDIVEQGPHAVLTWAHRHVSLHCNDLLCLVLCDLSSRHSP